MRPFLWKIVICLTPTLLSLGVCLVALWNYSRPPMQVGDYQVLSGLNYKLGVDLVGGTILVYEIDETKKQADYDKDKLVQALKRRLDPADLYNITIRAVSDTRIEIILPTGGRHRREAEEKVWQELLGKTQEKYNLPDGSLKKIAVGKDRSLSSLVYDKTRPSEKAIEESLTAYNAAADAKAKSEAWTAAVETLKKKYEIEKLSVKEGEKEELVRLVQRQAKPSADDVQKYVEEHWKSAGQKRDFTGDEVEQIKEKIQRVGSMEFAILANAYDDKRAIDAATVYLQSNDKANLDAIEAANRAGTPPPMPPGSLPGGAYPTSLTRDPGNPGEYTYRWVELGKDELHSLHLNNDAENDTSMREGKYVINALWKEVEMARLARKGVYPYGAALMFSRVIPESRRALLPEKDKSKQYEYFFLIRNTPDAEKLTGEYLLSAGDTQDNLGKLAVSFRFNTEGASRLYTMTRRNRPEGSDESSFHRQMAIILDDQVMSAPRLNQPLHDSGIITSGSDKGFTRKEVDQLVNILRAGALPATLKPQPVSENTMSATLGEDTIRAGTYSVAIAFIAVLIFMVVYYRVAGIIACTALLANLFLTVAFMVCVNATFTLPGLAGLVLMLAMAVDANVLIYERIREERERGASLALSIRNGYDRAFATVIDTHMSSIFTAVVLYVVGNDQLKGFGISLTVGLIISLFTSLYMTRVMFDICLAKRWVGELTMMKLLTKHNFPFMEYRKPVFITTVVTAGLGVFIFLLQGKDSLNMDFVGGTVYGGELKEMKSVSEIRDLLADTKRQEELLALSEEPKKADGSDSAYVLTYKSDGKKRNVIVQGEKDRTVTPADVKRRAEAFEVASVGLDYSSNPDVTQGDKSRFFTVRTSEKSRDIVEASIARLLGDLIKLNALKGATVEQVVVDFPKEVTLEAAKAELDKAFKDKTVKIKTIAPAVAFSGDKKETKKYAVSFEQPVAVAELEKALLDVKLGDQKLERAEVTTFAIQLNDPAFHTQVQPLLQTQLVAAKALPATQNIKVENRTDSTDEDNRAKEFDVTLPRGVTLAELQTALSGFQQEVSSRPVPMRLEIFDSQLAAETQNRALYAILASWGAILLYLWFRFGNWTFGAAAVLCLIHDVCMTLGMIVVAHWLHATCIGWIFRFSDFKIDLPAIASLLTLIGYSVNDTIVVFDRIREVRGKNPALTTDMINESVNGTLSRTVLTSFITLLTVATLYFFGGEGVHLFAYIMVVGVIIGTFSSIFVASPLLLILGEGRSATPASAKVPVPTAPKPMVPEK